MISQNYIGLDAKIRAIVESLLGDGGIDLSDYYTKEQVDALIASGGTGTKINYNDLLNRPIINGLLQSNLDISNHALLSSGVTLYMPKLTNDIVTFDKDVSIPNVYTKNDVYNKAEVDGEIDSIENYITTRYYTRDETYNKDEVDALIAGGGGGGGTNDYNKLINRPIIDGLLQDNLDLNKHMR